MAKIDLTGQRFGRLTVTDENPSPYISPGGKPTRRWNCVCDCGKHVTVLQNALTNKRNPTQSCGCQRAESMRRVGEKRQAYRVCTVCGKRYPCPPSSNSTTCSDECSTARKRETHKGNGVEWSPEKKVAYRERIRQNHERLTALQESALIASNAAKTSPNSGAFETNVNSKHWILKAPNNVLYEFDNLSNFIRNHPDWFPNPRSACTALCAVANGWKNGRGVSQYKGWQVVYHGKREGGTNNPENMS